MTRNLFVENCKEISGQCDGCEQISSGIFKFGSKYYCAHCVKKHYMDSSMTNEDAKIEIYIRLVREMVHYDDLC